MAIVLAQRFNGHHIFCGTAECPCALCEGLMLAWSGEGVDAIRARAQCELAWRTDEHEAEAVEMANIYFRLIKPGRVMVWNAPLWMADVADCGDMVLAKAEKEIADSIPKPKGR